MKKIISFCSMIMVILVGFILSSCCSPSDCQVKVTFVSADEELGLEDYEYEVKFNEPTKIQINIPEGFDHTKINATISGTVQEPLVEFEEEVEEEYYYSINKTLTYSIANVKRDFELILDLTEMPKLQFNVNLSAGLNDFKVVTVADETLKKLTLLNKNNTTSEISFVNQVAAVDYGENIFLIHTQNSSDRKLYNALYSEVNHFTLDKNKSSIGSIEYSEYGVSKKGNTRYYYDGDVYSSIFYIGEIKEDINIYPDIPGYVKEKGFKTDEEPNTFYLFTNLSEYNSDYCTIETYVATNETYNSSNSNLDKIGNVVVKKVAPNSIYKQRYDVHNIYIGSDLNGDSLLSLVQKNKLKENLYIKVSSTIGLEHIKLKLIKYEKEGLSEGYLLNADLVSSKGGTFIKLTKEAMMEFTIQRDMIDANQNVHTYYTGSAIFYFELDNNYFAEDRYPGKFKFSRFQLGIKILNTETEGTVEDFHFAAYIKDGEKRDYGLIDYHYNTSKLNRIDCIYFATDKLFDENNNYKNNLYVEVRGEEYQDYKSITISSITFHIGILLLTAPDPLYVEDPKVYNGYKEYLIDIDEKKTLSEYTILASLSLSQKKYQAMEVDFSHFELPQKQGEMVYATNKINFKELADFGTPITYVNQSTFNSVSISCNYDLYYFVRSASGIDLDFDIYLDPNDKNTKVSASTTLYDITGEPITIDINGEPYYVKVLMLDIIYDTIDGNLYALKK